MLVLLIELISEVHGLEGIRYRAYTKVREYWFRYSGSIMDIVSKIWIFVFVVLVLLMRGIV
jgi:hypothetical protein